MANDQLAVELFIDDKKADAVLRSNKAKLETFAKDVEKINPSLGNSFAGKYEQQLANATRRQQEFLRNQSQLSKGFDFEKFALGATAIGLSTAAVAAFGKEALNAAKEASNANLQLRSITIETGQSYDFLRKQAQAFGEQTLLSNRAAEATFAQIANFANAAGRSEKLDLFRRRFTDLAAAKGINASQLGDISRQLNALTDEATDKLLNANPSAFYDKFAKSLNKTAEQLTDAEKRAAIFDEVIRKGALFDGTADKRLNDASSATDKLSRSWENLKEKIGAAIVPLVDFIAKGGQFDFRTDAELAEVFKNQQILAKKRATEDANKLRASDAEIRAAQLNPFGNARNFALSNINLATGFNDVKARDKAIEQAVNDANKFIASVQKRLENANSLSGGNIGFLKLAQNEFRQFSNLFDLETREKIRKSLADAISNGAAQGFNKVLADTKTTLPELRKTLGQIFNNQDLTAETRSSLISQFSSRIEAEVEKGKAKIKELGKAYNDVFGLLSARAGESNPFVRLFTDAEKSMKSLRDSTRGLSKDLISTFEQMERRQNAINLFSARLDTQLNAFDLQSQANNFRNPFDAGKVRQEQEDFINRFIRNNPNYLFLQGKTAIDDQIRADILQRGFFDSAEKRANEQLENQRRIIFNNGLTPEQLAIADKKFIQLTQGLNPLELSNSLREQSALAREREAERLLKAESEAIKQREQSLTIQAQIRDELKKLNSIAEKEGLQGIENLVRIVDETGGKVRIAKTPKPADTERFMKQ